MIARKWNGKTHVAQLSWRLVGNSKYQPWNSVNVGPKKDIIGNWHSRRGVQYRSVESVVKELVDIVSKNGNLLLDIPVRGNGTIDEDEMKFIWQGDQGEPAALSG